MKVYVVDPTTYAGVMTDIANLGKLAGTSAQAQKGRCHDAAGTDGRPGQGRLRRQDEHLRRDLQQSR